eukprot:NODE_935_length_2999_cov_0.620110.p1 type:complete len:673 gc:universal NODE_935_length_2999_cov_0.620110:2312-294(-)
MINLLHKIYNITIQIGKTPQIFHENYIRPIHKNKSKIFNNLTFYRPICLSNAAKKLLEIVLKTEVMLKCTSGNNQFAYKPQSSTIDAAYSYMTLVESLGDQIYNYKTIQADIEAAFDSISHSKIKEYINQSDLNPSVKSIILNLVTKQTIQLKIGNNTSSVAKINRGILQGSVLSPIIFTAVVHHFTKHITIQDCHLFWYADDLLLVCHMNETDNLLNHINCALNQMGLHLNESKTCEIDLKFVTWLGFKINKFGLDLEPQIERNLTAARLKLKSIRHGGIFRNSLKLQHLARAFGSFVRPCIEYGLCLFQINRKCVDKINAFINRSIRNLCSIPRYFPNSDLHCLFQFDSFGHRWQELINRYHNKLSVKANKPNLLYYSPKFKMSFTLNKTLIHLYNKFPFMQSILKRNYPSPQGKTCTSCNDEHKFVNSMYKCHLSHLNTLPNIPKCDIFNPKKNLKLITSFKEKIQDIQANLDIHQCCIYTDASMHDKINASGGSIIIFHNKFYLKTFNFNNLHIDTSTRGEIAIIGATLLSMELNNYEISIYTDSQAAMNIIANYQNPNYNIYNIYSIDLISQFSTFLPNCQFIKVKGHDVNDKHSLNHLVDYLSHNHNAKFSQLKSKITKYKVTKEKGDGFRFKHFLKNYQILNEGQKQQCLQRFYYLHINLLRQVD